MGPLASFYRQSVSLGTLHWRMRRPARRRLFTDQELETLLGKMLAAGAVQRATAKVVSGANR